MEPEREGEAAADLSTTEEFLVDMHRLYPKKVFGPEDLRVHLTVTSINAIAELQRSLVDQGMLVAVNDDGEAFIETRFKDQPWRHHL